jgi:hypothetical protein
MRKIIIGITMVFLCFICYAQFNGFIDFSVESPSAKNINCSVKGAGYDGVYKDHWVLAEHDGSLKFDFIGKYSFLFHVLGSTIKGISYCRIDIFCERRIDKK